MKTAFLLKIEKNIGSEANELQDRQNKVALLHKIMKKINEKLDPSGQLTAADFQQIMTDLRTTLTAKRDAKLEGVEVNPENQARIDKINQSYEDLMAEVADVEKAGNGMLGKGKLLTKDQCGRLVENIRMTVEDLNTENEMQMTKVSRLHSERLEMFQFIKSILKSEHDAKTNHARKMDGR